MVRMCDETLDQSNEALLSRIAKLEEALILGNFSRAESAPKIEKKKEPQSEPEVKPADPEPVASIQTPVAANAQKRILRPLRNWMETVERIGVSDPMIFSFCRNAGAYATENGEILIRFDSAFAMDMIQKTGGRERIRIALSTVLKKEILDSALIFEAGETKEKSLIDEIIEAVEE